MSRNVARMLYEAGFGPWMVPVVPPGAPHVAAIQDHDTGKLPGRMNREGLFYPVAAASECCSSYDEAEDWDRKGYNVGLKLGTEAKHIAIDGDTDDPEAASIVKRVLDKYFDTSRGVADPKHLRRLWPVLITDVLPRGTTFAFEKNGVIVKIDLLSEGKQYVAGGTHKRTGAKIHWNQDFSNFADGVYEFPTCSQDALRAILDELIEELAKAGWVKVSGTVSAAGVDSLGVRERRTGTKNEVSRWLALCPNTEKDTQFDERSKWVAMCHAIYGASDGADWGRELWLVWCDQRPQTPGEAEKVWDTLKGTEGRVGLDYIREKARERNAKLAAQLDFEFAPELDMSDVEAMADKAGGKLWKHILHRYVWVSAQDCFYDLQTGERYSVLGLNTQFGHLCEKLQSEAFQHIPLKQKRLTFHQMFSAHPDAVKADNFTYWPGQPRLVTDGQGRYLVNNWRESKFNYKPGITDGDVQPWIDHAEIVCGNKADATRLIKWFAFIIQYPGEKTNHQPLNQTKPGGGKDNMLLAVIEALGQRNCREVTADDLAKSWTDFLEYKLVYVSETRQHSRGGKSSHDVMNDIKPYLVDTPKFVNVHRKHREPYQVPNLTQWVFFSNEHHPLYLADGDRRIWVINNLAADPPPFDYFEKFVPWNIKNAHLVASWLRDYPLTAKDVSEFKGHAPMNAAKKDLIAANRDPVEAALAEIIEEARHGTTFPTCIATPSDIAAELRNRVPNKPSGSIINRHLTALGAKPVVKDQSGGTGAGVVAVAGGKKQRLWLLAPNDAMGRDYSKLGTRDLVQIYDGAKWPANTEYHTTTGVPLTTVNGDDDI